MYKNWVLIDRNDIWIEHEISDGSYEYYKVICQTGPYDDPEEALWNIAHCIIDTNDEGWAETPLKAAWGADWKRMLARWDFLLNADSYTIMSKGLGYRECAERIIDLSCLDSGDPFLRFMFLNHEHDTENFRYLYVDEPTDGARVLVTEKRTSISVGVTSSDDLLDKFESVRICNVCGSPMESGFTDEESYFCCEEEFFADMDAVYGKGNWRAAEDDDADWCYEYLEDGEWVPEPSYWTSWAEY